MSKPWQPSHGFRHSLVLFGTLALALALPGPARAEGSVASDHADGPASGSETPPPIGVGATVAIGDLGVAALTAGFDAWYRPWPALAFGLEGQTFMVDNGADPDYCENCIESAGLITAFGELRIPSTFPVSAFVRAGVGPAFVQINQGHIGEPDQDEVQPALLLAAGPELTISRVFLRARGTATVLASESFLGYGAEIGAMF